MANAFLLVGSTNGRRGRKRHCGGSTLVAASPCAAVAGGHVTRVDPTDVEGASPSQWPWNGEGRDGIAVATAGARDQGRIDVHLLDRSICSKLPTPTLLCGLVLVSTRHWIQRALDQAQCVSTISASIKVPSALIFALPMQQSIELGRTGAEGNHSTRQIQMASSEQGSGVGSREKATSSSIRQESK